jgi:hypothetical protein
VGLLENIKAMPEARKAKPFTREEDYILYRFWDTRVRSKIAKEMHKGTRALSDRENELKKEQYTSYLTSLLNEFENE